MERSSSTRRRQLGGRLAILALAILSPLATPARAEDPVRFDLEVTIAAISEAKGDIDPKGRRLDSKLRKKFRYNSLEVVEQRNLGLALDEVGSVKLPDGRLFRVRPMNLGERGLLMSVELEGEVMMDMRARSEHLVVIGGPEFRDGQLVIGIEPEY